MSLPATVFILEHLHIHEHGEECVKRIGVYESMEAAEGALNRVATQPGFRDYPNLIANSDFGDYSGFYITRYVLGKDHWTEGYITIKPGEEF